MGSYENLKDAIQKRGRIAVAFSGGVDSTVVALAGRTVLKEDMIAIMLLNPTIPTHERTIAERIAKEIGMDLHILEIDIMEEGDFVSNSRDRCGICREISMPLLMEFADKLGFGTVADGANIDDLGDFRPGHEVSTRLGIWHPLIETGIGKEAGRAILKDEGVSIWNRPSTPCLATRIPYGQNITRKKLSIIEMGERYLRSIGFRNVRLRLHENIHSEFVGILELDDPRSAIERWDEILAGSPSIPLFLDPKGYIQGSMNLLEVP